MQAIPWCPPNVEPNLAAVLLPPGEATERDWWMALSDRVTSLVMRHSNPEAAMQQAARGLGLTEPDSPSEAGQILVQRNLDLRTAMTLAVMARGNPFPAKVDEPTTAAALALKQTDLETWLDLASSMVNGSTLD